MTINMDFISILQKHSGDFHPVVVFERSRDKVVPLDLSVSNPNLTSEIYSNSESLNAFIDNEKVKTGATYLIGGYQENRIMYRRSELFDKNIESTGENLVLDEPRSIHLGVDIWAEAGTKIFAPFGGMIHSFAYNNHFGDYGATIILQHQLDTINFYTLYGHLSLKDLSCRVGQFITRGQNFAHFGPW